MIQIKSTKILYISFHLLFISALVLSILVGSNTPKSNPLEAQTCPSGCYYNQGLKMCTGSGGCTAGCTGCSSCYSGYCCDRGDCHGCNPPACPAYYVQGDVNGNGCASAHQSCSGSYCTGESCGTDWRYCWLVKYTLTYSAGTGGYISGTTTQSVCRGSNGTQVTAVPNTGYYFVNWSDGITNPSRTETSVSADKSVTANFALSNQPPTAPTSLQTNNASNPVGIVGTPVFNAVFQDPDSGNTAIYYQIQVNTSSAFNGTVMWDSGKTSLSPAISIGARMPNKTYAGAALSNGVTYYWRIKFWDNSNVEGAWSSTAQFTMNTPPTAPTSLQTESAVNPIGVSDTTPEFSAIFNDPNAGDTATYFEIQVNTSSDMSGTVMWNSGQLSMTSTANGSRSPQLSYAGSALALNGSTYYWRIRFTDNYGTIGAWSTVAQFTMNIPPTAPTSLQTEDLVNPLHVTDTTPEFSAIFNDPNAGDTATYFEIQVNTSSDMSGTVMWNSGQLSMTSTANGSRSPQLSYAGSALALNGSTYYWRIRFTDNYGTIGAWSTVAQFTMDTSPSQPGAPFVDGVYNNTNVTDTTPEFSAIFNDNDSGDTAISIQIQVNRQSDFLGETMWDYTQSISPLAIGVRSSDISYNGTAIGLNGAVYYWRVRFTDSYGTVGAWSSSTYFIMQGSPNVPLGLLTDGMTDPNYLYSSTPSFSAVYSDPNSQNASAYEIQVNTDSTFNTANTWDSGKISTTVSSGQRSTDYTYSGPTLQNATRYYWRIKFWDTDDLDSIWSSTANFRASVNRQYFKGLKMNGIQLN